jgi:fructose-1,6-bisphosphatase/inositol monophosphatase family enzyme
VRRHAARASVCSLEQVLRCWTACIQGEWAGSRAEEQSMRIGRRFTLCGCGCCVLCAVCCGEYRLSFWV